MSRAASQTKRETAPSLPPEEYEEGESTRSNSRFQERDCVQGSEEVDRAFVDQGGWVYSARRRTKRLDPTIVLVQQPYVHPVIPKRPFEPQNPEIYFQLLEADLDKFRIFSQCGRYFELMSNLTITQLDLISAQIPDKEDPSCYNKLKRLLVKRFGESRQQQMCDFSISPKSFGESIPKEMCYLLISPHLRNLPPAELATELARMFGKSPLNLEHSPEIRRVVINLFLNNLPTKSQAICKLIRDDAPFEAVIKVAESIVANDDNEMNRGPPVANIAENQISPSDIRDIVTEVMNKNEISEMIDRKMSTWAASERSFSLGNKQGGKPAINGPKDENTPRKKAKFKAVIDGNGLCFYHATYGENAKKCPYPYLCHYKKKNFLA